MVKNNRIEFRVTNEIELEEQKRKIKVKEVIIAILIILLIVVSVILLSQKTSALTWYYKPVAQTNCNLTNVCYLNGTGCPIISTYNQTYDGYALNVSRNWTLDTYTNWNTIWNSSYNATYDNNRTNFSSFNATQMAYTGGYINILNSWLNGIYCQLSGCTMSGNLNMQNYNITNVSYQVMQETSGACNLNINHSICSNATGTYIVG